MSRPPLLPAPPRESARSRLTQRVNAYQPRATPWESNGGHGRGKWDGGCGRTVPARLTVPARVGDAANRSRHGPTMSARSHLPQRGNAYQPRVQPWENAYQPRVQPWEMDDACGERIGGHGRTVPARLTVPARVDNATTRGLPLECGCILRMIPRALPWAGPRCPVGAGIHEGPYHAASQRPQPTCRPRPSRRSASSATRSQSPWRWQGRCGRSQSHRSTPLRPPRGPRFARPFRGAALPKAR